jgi:hypothetical protein
VTIETSKTGEVKLNNFKSISIRFFIILLVEIFSDGPISLFCSSFRKHAKRKTLPTSTNIKDAHSFKPAFETVDMFENEPHRATRETVEGHTIIPVPSLCL